MGLCDVGLRDVGLRGVGLRLSLLAASRFTNFANAKHVTCTTSLGNHGGDFHHFHDSSPSLLMVNDLQMAEFSYLCSI
jgi:hypothetical protein